MSAAKHGLVRALSLFDGTMIVVGTIIGIGIFFTPGRVAQATGSAGLSLLAWGLGGLTALLGAATYAALGRVLPVTGGPYIYLREGLGRLPAFLYVYMSLCTIVSGACAVIGLIFIDHLARLVAIGPAWRSPAAAATILLLTSLNIIGVRWGGRVQNLLTILKLLSLCGLIAVGLWRGGQPIQLAAPAGAAPASLLGGLVSAMVGVLFSFGGWQNLSNVAGEMRRPERDLWRAILLGVAFVSIVYLLANLAYLRLLPLDRIAGSSQLAADAVAVACGGAAGDLAAALILCSAFGILNGLILSAPRLYFAAAQDGLLPLAVAAVHGRFRTPHIAVLLQGLVAAGLCFWGDVFKLLDYVIFADWLFFSLNALALFALARSGELRQRLRPLGYPVAPLLFLMVSVLMTVGVLVQQWENARIGLGILVLGVLLHAVAGRRKALDPQGPRS